jgi:hypothetical protein
MTCIKFEGLPALQHRYLEFLKEVLGTFTHLLFIMGQGWQLVKLME